MANLPKDLQERIHRIEKIREGLPERLRAAQEAQKHYYDQRHIPKTFQVGQRVMLSARHLRVKVGGKKLAPKFIGPFQIREPVGD